MLNKSEMLDRFPGMAYRCICGSADFPFEFVSEGCAELTGYTQEELQSKRLMDIVHPEDIAKLQELHEATLSFGMPLEASFWIRTKDGGKKQVLSRSRIAETNDVGMPHIAEGFLTDVTKLLQVENASTENRMNSNLWSQIGYGIRTPLNAIIGLAELGLREDMPETVRNYTQTIQNSGKKLMGAVNDIMDYQKLEGGLLELIEDEYELSGLTHDLIAFAKELSSGLDFHVFLDRKLPNNLFGDSSRLLRVLRNLISNAIKFTDIGYVSLSIEGDVVDDKANLRFIVSDTGSGIHAEDIGMLYTEFAQFNSKTIEGVGLGLTLCKKIIDLMGGEIEAISSYGTGSIFIVTVSQAIVNPLRPIATINDSASAKILFLENRQDYIDSITRTMDNLDVEYHVATSVAEFAKQKKHGGYSHVFAKGEPILPLYCLTVADAINGVKSVRNAFGVRFSAPTARVLVVDDISANLAVTEGFLQMNNIQVDLCESGEKAIEAMRTTKYDLVLMDYLMPVMNGAEAAIKIRELEIAGETANVSTPIIALTANTESSARELFKRSGIDDFLPKPININLLNRVLEKWIPRTKQEALHLSESASSDKKKDKCNLPKIDGLNVQKGVAALGGNPNLYMTVLKKYYENARRLIKELTKCAETGDTKMYLVHAHALNSVSATIGANEISMGAALLEKASDVGDLITIRTEGPIFVEKLEKLLDSIQAAIEVSADSSAASDSPSPSSGSKKKVLIIDDTVSYLVILDEILKDKYEPLTSISAEDGIETARKFMPDLILIDLLMPGMSGYEAIAILKNDPKLKHIPVIVLSGREQKESEKKLGHLDVANYIKKPFDTEVVRKAVGEILG